jgi:hypothetical protein
VPSARSLIPRSILWLITKLTAATGAMPVRSGLLVGVSGSCVPWLARGRS